MPSAVNIINNINVIKHGSATKHAHQHVLLVKWHILVG